MRGLLEIVRMEFRALLRSWSAALLLIAAVGWVLAVPSVVHGDGTLSGTRELTIAYSLGGALVLVVLSLTASATATLAREREARRLQLTVIRPVRYFTIVLGKLLAHELLGVAVLTIAALTLSLRVDTSLPCRHLARPLLPTPREEAEAMYASYMSDPDTSPEVKKASKAAVLRLLEARAVDHYQTIPTNSPVVWHFAGKGEAIRLRLTNPMELRQPVVGAFQSNGLEAALSNQTQTVMTIPLADAGPEISFLNRGSSALMLRPRKDIELLSAADGFYANLLRALLVLSSILALILAFAIFLSAGLGRPVALFTVISALILGLVSPSVVEQYPDELTAGLADRIGLELTRVAAAVTRPISAYDPISELSKDECVEYSELLRALMINQLAAPLLLCLISAFVIPRKQDGL